VNGLTGPRKQMMCRGEEKVRSLLLEGRRSANPSVFKAIRTLKNWQVEVLNSFVFNYSNGFLEGINNKTKVMKRNAYGFRRFDHARRYY